MEAIRSAARPTVALTAYATEILLRAVDAPGITQGSILALSHMGGYSMQVQQRSLIQNPSDAREVAAYKHGLEQLMSCGLAERVNFSHCQILYNGYLMADELKARGAEAYQG